MATAGLVLIACSGGGEAQQFSGGEEAQQLIPPLPQVTETCDMDLLSSRIDAVNKACSASACDVGCVTVLFPLLEYCRGLLNALFDSRDGVADYEYHRLSDKYDQCANITITQIIDTLKTLQGRGQCPSTFLDGVASKEIEAAQCADVWQEARCGLSITSGLMTCERDFCHTAPTPDAPCVMAGQCDSTCGFCHDDGEGHRRFLALRQLQMVHVQCAPDSFAEQASVVDAACCGVNDSCEGGIPTHCDAECALVFINFYNDCRRFLSSQSGIDEMSKYARLYQTCTTLPILPLLDAVVQCSSNAPDPCYDIDCGQQGICDGGSCQCDEGYTGDRCDVFAPCASVECGDHGQCVRGSCQCEDRYSGQSCEVAASPCCTLIIACGPSNVHPCAGYDGSCGCAGQCLGSCARACDGYAWCDQSVHGWDSVCDRSC